MLKWPDRAKLAIRKLFEPLQDIDVYVEDENDEAFYRALLNAANSGSVTVARVFGAGGRQAVLDAAAAHDHNIRRALFIIDGDLPWVRGEKCPSIFALHQHQAYCVENLLICDRAIATILSQETNTTESDAKKKFDYLQWRGELLPALVELFAAYATVNVFNSSYPTVSNSVALLCTKWKLDVSKVKAARDAALSAAIAVSDQKSVDLAFNEILLRIYSLQDPLIAISGKDYLLPLLGFRLSGCSCKIRKSALRIRLASLGNLGRFSALANALIAAALRAPQPAV